MMARQYQGIAAVLRMLAFAIEMYSTYSIGVATCVLAGLRLLHLYLKSVPQCQLENRIRYICEIEDVSTMLKPELTAEEVEVLIMKDHNLP